MSQAQRKPMTPEEFVGWEAKQELKWEFDGFEPVAMTGGSVAHAGIQRNLVAALVNRLRGKPCRPFGSDLKVPTPNGSYRYPDALVTCVSLGRGALEAPEPVVLFEVLSPSTEHDDRGSKLREYLSIPSLRRYVMLEQDEALATVLSRTPTGWAYEVVYADGTLAMPEIEAEIPLAELYLDLD